MPKRRAIVNDVELEPHYLREWREYKGLTQKQVAQAIRLDQAGLSRVEQRKVPYDQVHLQQLSKLYNVSIPDLLYRDPDRPRPADAVAEKVKRLESTADIRAVETLIDALLARR